MASYQLGFDVAPLVGGKLDTSGDHKGGCKCLEEDPLYKMCLESRDGGNKMTREEQYEPAVGCYSQLIMQLRGLESESEAAWTEAERCSVRELRATAYLNLSLCFLKTQQWTHASNCATRALIGDKDPPDPKEEAALAPEKKAKALFRRSQAQSRGFGNFGCAREDLQASLQLLPGDSSIIEALERVSLEEQKALRAADRELSGFLTKSKRSQRGGGIFGEPQPASQETSQVVSPGGAQGGSQGTEGGTEGRSQGEPSRPPEPIKMKDGLWLWPPDKSISAERALRGHRQEDGEIDFDELSREIRELREERPDDFCALREQVREMVGSSLAAPDDSGAQASCDSGAQASCGSGAQASCGSGAPA